MPANKGIRWEKIFTWVIAVNLLLFATLMGLLFGRSVEPIQVGEPPEFVELSEDFDASEVSVIDELDRLDPVESESDSHTETAEEDSETDLGERIASDVEVLAKRVVLEGESVSPLLEHFRSDDPIERFNAAIALGEAFRSPLAYGNERYELVLEFCERLGEDIDMVQEVLYEALVISAATEKVNGIPYIIGRMPGDNTESLELLAWTSRNHRSSRMRGYSMFLILDNGPHSHLASQVFRDRSSDPSLRVRVDALGNYVARWFHQSNKNL